MKKKWIALVMLLALVFLAACGNTGSVEGAAAPVDVEEKTDQENGKAETVENETKEAETAESKTKEAEIAESETKEAEKAEGTTEEAGMTEKDSGTEDEEAGQEGTETEIIIYYSNKNADGLESETITAGEITPDIIVNNLARHNIVSIDTKVNGFERDESAENDRVVITLNLSKAFGEYIKTMGTSGETMIMAALTNTFLEAYQADGLKLLVEGKALETGHEIYEDELTYIEIPKAEE